MRLKLLALALLVASLAQASPTRVRAIDGGRLIAPDDTDATVFYHLAPNFADHWYLQTDSAGLTQGWAFLPVPYATLVIWWNHPYAAEGLFTSAATGSTLGILSTADLNASAPNAHDPLDGRVKAPDNKVSVGLAVPFGEAIDIGFCVQWAGLKQNLDKDGGTGAFFGSSNSRILTDAAYAPQSLSVAAYANTQSSSGLAFAPSLGFKGGFFTVDLKGEVAMNKVENKHHEELRDAAGASATQTVSLDQTLMDKGDLSYGALGRVRYNLDGTKQIVAFGGWHRQALTLERKLKAAFTGSFSAYELAGVDHVDYDSAFTRDQLDLRLGWLQSVGKNKATFVLAAGYLAQNDKRAERRFSARTGGATMNDIVKDSDVTEEDQRWSVPLVLGTEVSPNTWLKLRGTLARNVLASRSFTRVTQAFDTASGNLLTRVASSAGTDLAPDFDFATGAGFLLGDVTWDILVNAGFLASTGALANPAAQSSITYAF